MLLAVGETPAAARLALGDGRHGRRPHARDGAEPADRRRARRAEPAHRLARAAGRIALAGAGRRRSALLALARLPRRRLPARPARPLALADAGRAVRRLPVPEAGHVALPPWLGVSLGLAPVGAWVAVTGELPWQAWALGGAVALWVAGFDLFYSLFDARARPGAGAALVGGAVRRARRVPRRAPAPPRRRSRCSPPRGSGSRSASRTGSASRRSPRCSPTSTRSSGPAICAASTPRSSPSTASSASSSSASSSLDVAA